MDLVIRRFDVYWVNLDPTIGREIRKTRPCVIVSPNELNERLATVIIAPLTTRIRPYPTRVDCVVDGRPSSIVLDQLRTMDVKRLLGSLGTVDTSVQATLLNVLAALFAE